MALMTYWDLSEKERADLTEKQVEAYCDIALAEAGVLRPIKPPHYEKPQVGDVTPPGQHWKVSWSYHKGIAFRTTEQAQRFLELEPLEIDYDHEVGSQYTYGKPILGPIEAIGLFDYNEILAKKGELSKYHAAQKTNEQAIDQYKKDCKAVQEATAEIWSDWHTCRETRGRYRRIIDVREEYVILANGDTEIARGFLLKAFSESDIQAAEAWFSEMSE